MELDRHALADQIEQAARQSLDGKRLTELLQRGRKPVTMAVMRTFGDLGTKLGYEIAAKHYPAEFGEWLYDMSWFGSDADRTWVSQPVAIESELKPGNTVRNSADVEGDFQKLVQARTDVRVWLAACPSQELAKAHLANCERRARAFSGVAEGDVYVFIIHIWSTEVCSITRFEV